MQKSVLAAMLLALSSSFAAAEVNSLSGKAMNDLPGTKGGFTQMPNAKVYSNSLADKAVQDRIGLNAGRTANPLAQPEDGSLSGKAMKDLGART